MTSATPHPAPFITDPHATLFEPIVKLPDGWLACRMCGVATAPEQQHGTEHVVSLGRVTGAATPPGRNTREFKTEMSRCSDCTERSATAEQLVADWPTGRGRYLSPKLAAHVAERALVVAAVVGQQLNVTEPRHLRHALDILAPVGSVLSWMSRFIPIAARDADPATGAATPWAHLNEQQLRAARVAFAEMLRARSERPTPIPPPIGAGCWICGVATVTALPSAAAHAWRTVTLRPTHLGGDGLEPITAAVCGPCAREHDAVGSWGPSMLERAVLRTADADSIPAARGVHLDLQAWGVTGRAKPNRTRFEHLDLARLRDDLRSGALR